MIDGTSGYDYLNQLNGIFVNSDHADRLREIYVRFTHQQTSFEDIAYAGKKLIMSTSLASELNVLAYAPFTGGVTAIRHAAKLGSMHRRWCRNS